MVTWWKEDKRLNTVAATSLSNNSVNVDDSRIKISEKSGPEATESYDVTPGSKVSILRIRNIVLSDQGVYSCTASNKSGHFVTKFNVTITGKKEFLCTLDV